MSEPAPRLDGCFHCGDPLPSDPPELVVEGSRERFCCPACRAVTETILGSGLAGYYRFRDPDQNREPAAAPARFDAFDQPAFERRWLRDCGNGMVETELLLEGMHCAACVWLIEHRLRNLPGVETVQVSLSEQRAHIRWNASGNSPLRLSEICSAIAGVGYQPQPYSSDRFEQIRQRDQQRLLRQLGVAGLASMQVGMGAIGLYAGDMQGMEIGFRDLIRWASLLLSLPIVFYSALPFYQGAWRGLRARRAGMDLPIALAIVLGFAASVWATWRGTGEVYFDSVTMFVFLLLGGRYLELRARRYGGRLGHDLASLLPAVATRCDNAGVSETVPLDLLAPGDRLIVPAGQTVAADGVLLETAASLNEAALTGEFMPVRKQPGDAIYAGTVNGDQPLLLEVTATAGDLRLAAIEQLSRQAQQHKPRLAQLADRLAAHFAVAVLLIAGGAWLTWHWLAPDRAFWIALSVLVVSCPCALGLATPVALTNATNTLRRLGLLVTRGNVWEALPAVTDVVFDKTGTLTEGRVAIVDIRPCEGRSEAVCRDLAAALEIGSSHPIAAAFARPRVIPASQRRDIGGAGVEGTIAGRRYRLGRADFASPDAAPPPDSGHWLALADEHATLCWFAIDDAPRPETAAVTAALRARGLRLHLLSGDSSDAVPRLAAQLDIACVRGGASAADKLDYIRALQQAGRRVLMVGDGLNDIPVLAAADVSVAMSNASQLAKGSADCILLAPQLDRLPQLFEFAGRTRRIVYENLGWALAYNLIALPAAALGLVAPWLAALGMSLSSLLVVLNALRLQRPPTSASPRTPGQGSAALPPSGKPLSAPLH